MRYVWVFIVFWNLSAATLRADSITLGQFTYDNVHIDNIDGGQIYFTINGDQRTRPLTDMVSLNLADHPQFNAGEYAYEQKQWDAAAYGLSRALADADSDWLKNFIAPRLLDAANQSGRFADAVAAWTQIASTDPDGASKATPSPSGAPGAALDSAEQELQNAAKAATGPARHLILGLLLDVENARQDTQAAADVARQIQADAATGADAADPGLADQSARLALARAALSDGKFDDAIAQIDSSADILTDPQRQADALFIKAQALEAKTEQAKAASTDDWKDVSLAYLRVYVHFRDGPAAAHAAQSLVKAARIVELRLHEPAAALKLYQKVVSEYKNSPQADQAQREVDRLGH